MKIGFTWFVSLLFVTSTAFAGASSPVDNFYLSVNQEWLDHNPIPEDKLGINNFVTIQKKVNDDIVAMVQTLQSKPNKTVEEQKLINAYESILAVEHPNSDPLKPLRPYLKQINNAKSYNDVAKLFAQFEIMGIETPLMAGVSGDFKDSSRNIMIVSQAGLGITRENYLGKDRYSLHEQELYRNLLTQLFSLSKITNPKQVAQATMTLEKDLAKIQWSNIENRDYNKLYNITNYKTLNKTLSNLYLDDQFKILGYPKDQPIDLLQPSYAAAFNSLFKKHSLSTWKAYLQARMLVSYAPLIDSKFKSAYTEYEIQRGLYTKPEPITLQAIGYLNHNVGELLGKEYIKHYFDESIKLSLKAIVKSITDEYAIAIQQSSRMGDQTKQKALEKLNKMTFKIGYPDQWRDYSSLTLNPNEPIANHIRIQNYEFKRNLAKLGKPVDKNEWGYPPQEINAFYDPSTNSFVLLAGILHEPFYMKNGSDAQNYGGIGFIIGHEIGHGFDDQGSLFDANGNLINWWSDEDRAIFNTLKSKLITQANNYEILPGKKLKGELEIGEIIGDLSGAEISLRAYKKVIQSKQIDPVEAKKAFFTQLAKTWRDHLRPNAILMFLDTDVHPPSEFRTNGIVKNMDDFHQLYSTKPGDTMYAEPSDRVKLW